MPAYATLSISQFSAKDDLMLRSPKLLLALILLFASPLVSAQKLSDQEIEQRVNSLLQQMTIEEKAGQLAQFAGNSPQTIEMIKQG
ncbi:MAG: hypothetical protein DMG95_10330, partial [Acidobacteria bacterium]